MTSLFQFVGTIVDILYLAILSRLLSPSDFGIVATATLFLAFCNLLREIGIGATIVQMLTLSDIEQRTAFTIMLLSSTALFVFAVVFAPYFAAFMNTPESGGVLKLLAFIIVIQAFGSISESLLLRKLEMRRVRIVEIASKIFAFGIPGITLAYLGFGYWALAIATICEASARSAGLMIIARPSMRLAMDRASVRRLMGTGSGFTASRVFNFIALRADITVVGRYLDVASLGFYSRAFRLMNLPTEVYSKMADRVVFPAMAKVQSDAVRLRAAFVKGVELTALFGLPMSAVLFILSPEIVRVLLGPKWDQVTSIFSILAIFAYFRLASRVSGSLLRATASIRSMISSQALYATLTAAGCLFAVQYGLNYVAFATGLSIFLTFCVMTVQACRVSRLSLGNFLSAHRYGVNMALISGIPVFILAYLCRSTGMNEFLVLGFQGVLLSTIGLILLFTAPSRLIGHEGAQFSNHIKSFLLHRLKPTKSGS